MKKTILLALSAAVIFLAGGCRKQSFRHPVPGEPIKFRAVSNVDSRPLDTKTVYTGAYFTTGSGEAGRKFEHIDWKIGDKISVGYVAGSAASLAAEYWDYDVTGVSSPNRESDPSARSSATLSPSGGNGLVWKDASTHLFRGMYPNAPDDPRFRFAVEDGQFVYNLPCLYPIEPVLSRDGESNNYVEDMKYAWMLATDDGAVQQVGDAINLRFDMHFTAFQVTFDSADAESLTIKSVSLSDANDAVAGDFVYSEDAAHHVMDEDGNHVSKRLTAWFNEAHEPITLAKGTPVTVTVFTSCAHVKKAMTLSFSLVKNGAAVNRSLKLARADADTTPDENGIYNYGITFDNPLKHIITGINIPLDLQNDPNGWFEAPSAGEYTNQDW